MENVKVGQETGEACPECGEARSSRSSGASAASSPARRYPECKYTKDLGGRREAGRRADGRDLPDLQQADGHQAGPLRQVHRLLGISGVQDHQAGDARHRLPGAGLRGPARRAPHAPGQDVLLVHELSRPASSPSGRGRCSEPCPKCAAPFLTERYARGGKVTRACIREELRLQAGDRADGRCVSRRAMDRRPIGRVPRVPGGRARGVAAHGPRLCGGPAGLLGFLRRAGDSVPAADATRGASARTSRRLHQRGLAKTSHRRESSPASGAAFASSRGAA